MIDFYVLRLRKTFDGKPMNGKWRGHQWVDGETIFSTYYDARQVRSRMGGDIINFKESNLYQKLTQEYKNAISAVENLNMGTFGKDSTPVQPTVVEPVIVEKAEETTKPAAPKPAAKKRGRPRKTAAKK
jgi:hypothetical protein